jgi:hypothetical protein
MLAAYEIRQVSAAGNLWYTIDMKDIGGYGNGL